MQYISVPTAMVRIDTLAARFHKAAEEQMQKGTLACGPHAETNLPSLVGTHCYPPPKLETMLFELSLASIVLIPLPIRIAIKSTANLTAFLRCSKAAAAELKTRRILYNPINMLFQPKNCRILSWRILFTKCNDLTCNVYLLNGLKQDSNQPRFHLTVFLSLFNPRYSCTCGTLPPGAARSSSRKQKHLLTSRALGSQVVVRTRESIGMRLVMLELSRQAARARNRKSPRNPKRKRKPKCFKCFV